MSLRPNPRTEVRRHRYNLLLKKRKRGGPRVYQYQAFASITCPDNHGVSQFSIQLMARVTSSCTKTEVPFHLCNPDSGIGHRMPGTNCDFCHPDTVIGHRSPKRNCSPVIKFENPRKFLANSNPDQESRLKNGMQCEEVGCAPPIRLNVPEQPSGPTRKQLVQSAALGTSIPDCECSNICSTFCLTGPFGVGSALCCNLLFVSSFIDLIALDKLFDEQLKNGMQGEEVGCAPPVRLYVPEQPSGPTRKQLVQSVALGASIPDCECFNICSTFCLTGPFGVGSALCCNLLSVPSFIDLIALDKLFDEQ
ncbi:hypothetical protein HHK36_001672 [Tetracentron sinense]|uniref:Uncharacterized protein n=1 Tax=Tetracentron sinense TaxID=13715 RepID=A0A834ZXY1_TETSI|nr:hypothetical protein HHK36_001672 [Tetracentron sinense]